MTYTIDSAKSKLRAKGMTEDGLGGNVLSTVDNPIGIKTWGAVDFLRGKGVIVRVVRTKEEAQEEKNGKGRNASPRKKNAMQVTKHNEAVAN